MKLAADNVVEYLATRGVVPRSLELSVEELAGGVSGTVLAVRGPGVALVVKQALPQLRVADEWLAPARRTDTEAAALRLAARLIPGCVPPVVDSDSEEHVVVLQHAPAGWRNWQVELLDGRAHITAGSWAGDTLGRLHSATANDAAVAAEFDDYEAFSQLRLEPYYGTAMERLPRLASAIEPLADELRTTRTCLVHGDYAPKNILLGRDGRWILDAEVAHVGNPVFDLAFFLVFPLLSALRRPEVSAACGEIIAAFNVAYGRRARALLPPPRSVAEHTGAMLLARTDGRSPATFLNKAGLAKARAIGERMLLDPETHDLAALVASLS